MRFDIANDLTGDGLESGLDLGGGHGVIGDGDGSGLGGVSVRRLDGDQVADFGPRLAGFFPAQAAQEACQGAEPEADQGGAQGRDRDHLATSPALVITRSPALITGNSAAKAA